MREGVKEKYGERESKRQRKRVRVRVREAQDKKKNDIMSKKERDMNREGDIEREMERVRANEKGI